MRSMRMKFKHTKASAGRLSPQHTLIEPGFANGVCTIEITNIPKNVTAASVLWAANQTTFLPADFTGQGRYSYRYDEIGPGKIITK